MGLADAGRPAAGELQCTVGTAGSAGSSNATVIAAADPHAVAAGHAMLARGGGAIDAAIAAVLALGVVEPAETGIGGGGFLLFRDGATGESILYDGRETAPEAANPKRFLLPGGIAMSKPVAIASGRAVGVPGLLAMLELAHRDHGRLAWPALFAPAIRLAEEGVPTPLRLAEQVRRDPSLDLFTGTRRLFADIDAGGGRWRNPRLAQTLRKVAEAGPEAFYKGPIAAEIVKAVRNRSIYAGDMTRADLEGYRAVRRSPVCGLYRQWRICGAPPPSAGGIAVLQILKLLERFDMAALEPVSAQALHLIAEASRLAYADRARHIGDPAFVEVPVQALTDPDYLAARSSLISPRRAMAQAPAGAPPKIVAPPEGGYASAGGGDTSHLSVLDCAGNAVALTSSIEAPFGSRNAVRGFLLNNQLTDFAFHPMREGRPVANRVEAGKRPMSAMSPTIVTEPRGRVRLVIGARGGPRIIGYVAKTIVAVLDWELPLEQALALPNFLHTGDGSLEIEDALADSDILGELKAMGHKIEIETLTSGLHGVERVEGRLRGAADPRMGGAAR